MTIKEKSLHKFLDFIFKNIVDSGKENYMYYFFTRPEYEDDVDGIIYIINKNRFEVNSSAYTTIMKFFPISDILELNGYVDNWGQINKKRLFKTLDNGS